jgi:hypothetical protein
MLKIKKSYSVSKLRKNILFITKDDFDFRSTCGNPQDMFFYLWDQINGYLKDAVFYNIYIGDIPIAYLCISKRTKQIAFYLDKSYRTSNTLTEMFSFIKSKIGNEFYTGTKKTNTNFIVFAAKNNWLVVEEDDKNIIFKARI